MSLTESGRCVVNIGVNNVEHSFRRFDTLEKAAQAADRARTALHAYYVGDPAVQADQELIKAA